MATIVKRRTKKRPVDKLKLKIDPHVSILKFFSQIGWESKKIEERFNRKVQPFSQNVPAFFMFKISRIMFFCLIFQISTHFQGITEKSQKISLNTCSHFNQQFSVLGDFLILVLKTAPILNFNGFSLFLHPRRCTKVLEMHNVWRF